MKYFTLEEFQRSETAHRMGIDNSIPLLYIPNITRLVDNVLDPLREAYGNPIRITSGYRCPKLNKAVGGVYGSQHQYGMAADIVGTPNTRGELYKLASLVKSLNLEHDQMILEKNSWIHISYKEGSNRNLNFRL